jgi:hypothetical protein
MVQTMTYSNERDYPRRKPPNLVMVFFLLLLLFSMGQGISHAAKHALEAEKARKCLNDHGPDWVIKYKFHGQIRANQYCFDPKTKELFIRIAKIVEKKWEETTAYRYDVREIPSIEDAFKVVLEDLYGTKGSYFSYIKPMWESLKGVDFILPLLFFEDDFLSLIDQE